jgi:gas vesicle protein
VVLDEDRKLGVVLNYPSLKIINSGILTGDVKLAQMYELIVNSIEQIYEGDKVHMAKDTDKKELDDFVNNLSGEQMRKIQNFFETMPRLEQKVKVMNSKTKVESEVTLKGLADFFG